MTPVSREEQAKWMRWLIPLPKQVKIESKLAIEASRVSVKVAPGGGDLTTNAARALETVLKTGPGDKADFEILIGVCDGRGRVGGVIVPEAARLSKLPNRDQAYCIAPVGSRRLVVTALSEKGVLYGATTLHALMEPKLSNGRATVPIARIVDWPDIGERGRWGGVFNSLIINNINDEIEWMASLKMNLIETHVSYDVSADGHSTLGIDLEAVERARLSAVRYVPIIIHMDLLGDLTGLYKVYPEAKGKGAAIRGASRNSPRAMLQALTM